MASSSVFSEDQFLCPICLEVFTHPVSTPCGHNFCMSCIKIYWDNAQTCLCPVCKESFKRRPILKVNTFISELVLKLRSIHVTDVHAAQQPGTAVLCDICTDSPEEAVKSCLECLTSFCSVHLEPHHRAAGLKKHTLIEPVASLEDKTCKEHNNLLVFFCKADRVLLCEQCAALLHRLHDIVPIKQACIEMKDQVVMSDRKVQQMIVKRLQGVKTLQESIQQTKREGEQLKTSAEQELTKIVLEIQSIQTELIRRIDEKQKATEVEAGGLIRDMERETGELQTTAVKLGELKQTTDQLSFLRKYQRFSLPPNTMDLSAVNFDGHTEVQRMHKSMRQSVHQLQFTVNKMKAETNEFSTGAHSSGVTTLRNVQHFEVDVELDPDTAHPMLILSDDRKQVKYSHVPWPIQNPRHNMFTEHLAVLGHRGFISQKFYFEVFVGRKTEWCLGVATASIKRRGTLVRSPCSGLWAIWFLEDHFETFSCPNVPVHLGKVEQVGVFVDYDAGQILFFDVMADCTICSLTGCCFAEELYPYFNPCDNEYGSNLAPIKIVPVRHMV